MISLGQKITAVPTAGSVWKNGTAPEKAVGTVVYIHPSGRFVTLEFEYLFGRFRESFQMQQFLPKQEPEPPERKAYKRKD